MGEGNQGICKMAIKWSQTGLRYASNYLQWDLNLDKELGGKGTKNSPGGRHWQAIALSAGRVVPQIQSQCPQYKIAIAG